MIVNPDKSVFFVATAVMCSVSLYAAELSTAEPDPMTRVYVGEPNHLTLPPGFPAATAIASEGDCRSAQELTPVGLEKDAVHGPEGSCDKAGSDPLSDTIRSPRALGAASAKTQETVQPVSVGPTERIH